MTDAAAWIAIASLPGVGPLRYQALLNAFGHPEAALAAPAHRVAAVPGWNAELASRLRSVDRAAARALAGRLAALGGRLVTCLDPAYPAALRAIYDPPPFLYALGDLAALRRPCVAIVGARRATPYGRRVAAELAADLALAGVVVVSGMARGIDGAAHEGALRAAERGAGPPTIAVLGSGVDVPYPPEHRELYRRIVRHGLVLSEFGLGARPSRQSFPRRNRLISGLSRGVVVVEAAASSGTRHTVEFATDQGRDVFAVPGPVTSPLSAGPHQLLRDGARLCAGAADVLGEIGLPLPPGVRETLAAGPGGEARVMRTTPAQRRLLACLDAGEPVSVEDLCALARIEPPEAMAALAELELGGLVQRLPGMQFLRR